MAFWTPSYLTLPSAYSARMDRVTYELLAQAPGVPSVYDLRVTQRAAGANFSVDVSAGWASIRHTTLTPGGLYGVYQDSSFNTVGYAADPSNPRVDLLSVRVLDVADSGDASNDARLVWTKGTAMAGASLANLIGVPAGPANSLRLAYVLIPAGASSITNSNILDVRPISGEGVAALYDHAADVVALSYPPSTPIGTIGMQQAAYWTGMVRVYLPRRIVNASKIYFQYQTSATPPTGGTTFQFGLMDQQGRLIANTAVTSWSTAASTRVASILALSPTVTLEAGNYYLFFTGALNGAGASVYYPGAQVYGPNGGLGMPGEAFIAVGAQVTLADAWTLPQSWNSSGTSATYCMIPTVALGS